MSTETDTILRDYPSFAYLLNDPEIGPLLLAAVDPNQGFDVATFQAKIMQTNWWRTTTASARQWETLVATDPATAQQRTDSWKSTLKAEATKAGMALSDGQVDYLTNFYLPRGFAANDPQVIRNLAAIYKDQPAIHAGGGSDIENIKAQMRDVAGQYLQDVTTADYDQWAARIWSGETDIQAYTTQMRWQAAQRFSMYADEIQQGMTPSQLFGQQRNAIARELEVDPTTIDLLHDARWSKVLGIPGPDGKVRPMTYNESVMLARQQPEWARTASAKQQGADLTKTLLETFGKIA